jgi:protein pelota
MCKLQMKFVLPYDVFSNDPDRAAYDETEVRAANEQLAIETLLLADTLYQADYQKRGKYIQLMDSVKANGGKVYKFYCLHVSGEQLNLYTDTAATLRFPVSTELHDDDDDDDDIYNETKTTKDHET